MLGRTSVVWTEKSGSPTSDVTHISSVYSGGVPLIWVHNYVNEVGTREEKKIIYILLFGNDKLNN